MEKIILTIDGRVCSGKTSLAKELKKVLTKYYGYEIPHYSCGEYYRKVLKESLPNEQVDDAMIAYLHKIYQNNDVAIIDGRSAGFSLQDETEKFLDKPLITILCDVNKIEQVKRIKKRFLQCSLQDIAYEFERDKRDKSRCFKRFGKDIFDARNYDIYLDTSDSSIEQNISLIMDILEGKIGIREKEVSSSLKKMTEAFFNSSYISRNSSEK